MTAHTARRLRTALLIMLVCIPVALCYQFVDAALNQGIEDENWLIGGFIGILLAMPLALLEESSFDERMRRLPFSVAVLAKSLTYIGSLLAAFALAGLIVGALQGLNMDDFWASLAEPGYYVQAAVGFLLYTIIVFSRQLDRLLGPGVLVRYLLGRYHRPRREARIFMFLDLKSSTSLAEDLGPEAWKEERGIKDANCIRVFFDIDKPSKARSKSIWTDSGSCPHSRPVCMWER